MSHLFAVKPLTLTKWHHIWLISTMSIVSVTFSYSVFAGLNATATNSSPQTVSTGTLKLSFSKTDSSNGFTQSITNMVPGDTVNRYVTLTNGGTLNSESMTLQVSTGVGDSTGLISASGGTKPLQVAIDRCSVKWTWTASSSTCSGTSHSILSTTNLSILSSAQTFNVNNGTSATMTAGSDAYLRVSVSLPDQDETVVNGTLPAATIQGGTANLTFTFTELQPTGTSSSS